MLDGLLNLRQTSSLITKISAIEIICSDDDDNVLQYDRVEIAILRLTDAMLKRVAS